MREHPILKKARRQLLASMFAFSVCFTLGWQQVMAADLQHFPCKKMRTPANASTVKGQHEKTSSTGKGATAMRAYIDPTTGEIIEPPASARAAEVSESLQNSLSTSVEGLEETPSPVPGGGVLLNLKGRFQSPLIATPGADGTLSIQHMPAASGSDEKH